MWLKEVLSNKYEIKCTILGPEAHQAQSVKILGRTMRWSDVGIEYEADPRHCEIVLKELNLENCKPVSMPFGPEEQGCLPGQGELLGAGEATRYRR